MARRAGRRWVRRVGGLVLVLVLLVGAGVVALWFTTPGVADAGSRVRAILAEHHAAELQSLPTPDRVAQALVATEDSRFYETPGVDPVSVVRAGFATLARSPDVGGATLEQQLAKNLYFGQDDSLGAKVQEVGLALKLDAQYPKEEVLRMYLAEVYFGHGYYGLPAAARGYFGTTPDRLTWAQASMLAGLVQAPSAYDPQTHLAAGKARQRHVLDRLVATAVLTQAQADAAYRAPLGLR